MKKLRWIIAVFILIGAYAGFIYITDRDQQKGASPVLNVPGGVLNVSVKDGQYKFKQGVTASDVEDGDLTGKVFVENVSGFDDQGCRTVTLSVFDSDDHLTRATRQIKYDDYTKPVLSIDTPLCVYYVTSTDDYKTYMKATSSIDGDISSRIKVDKFEEKDHMGYVTFSVEDSSGNSTTGTYKVTYLNKEPNVTINLTEAMIDVEQKTSLDYMSYVDSVEINGNKNESLKEYVSVESDYNSRVPGTYEVYYTFARNGVDYGQTKLVVNVK